MTSWDAIVLAGGQGTRFVESASLAIPKQFYSIHGTPVLIHTLRAISRIPGVRRVFVAVPESELKLTKKVLEPYQKESLVEIITVKGGAKRQESSRLAVEAIAATGDVPARVLIHDACRPNLSKKFRERILTTLLDRSLGAWVPVVPVIETLKRVEGKRVKATVNRSELVRVQTPQIFEFALIQSLMEKIKGTDQEFTDDASIAEFYGMPVGTFEGDPQNIKMTYLQDVTYLASVLGSEIRDSQCELASDMTSIV